MKKITLTYEDFNEVERTEDFYFNLTEAELTELELSEDGGFLNTVETLYKAQNMREVYAGIKKILLMSYGEKTPDGRSLLKTDEIRTKFASTQAFSDILLMIGKSDETAADFVLGIIPKKMREEVTQQFKANGLKALPVKE